MHSDKESKLTWRYVYRGEHLVGHLQIGKDHLVYTGHGSFFKVTVVDGGVALDQMPVKLL